jgi:hypothetical protein
MSTSDLRESMHAQVRAAEEDIKRLRAAIRTLEDPEPGKRTPRTSPRTLQVSESESKPVVPVGKLMRLLKDSDDGLTASALAKETDGDQSKILALLKAQEADGKVMRTGQRRATRWHLTNGA